MCDLAALYALWTIYISSLLGQSSSATLFVHASISCTERRKGAILSVASEITASTLGFSTPQWKFLCARYLFIIGLATFWINGKVRLNKWTFILSILSIFFIWLFRYQGFKFEPWCFDTSWNQCHWFCYFYPAFLVAFILFRLYKSSAKWLKRAMIVLGKASYEIFLMQMTAITILKMYLNSKEEWLIYIPSVWVLSIVLGLCFHKLLSIKPSFKLYKYGKEV